MTGFPLVLMAGMSAALNSGAAPSSSIDEAADSEDEMQQAARLGSAGARMALLQRACAAGPCGGAEGGGGREL